MHFNAVFSVEYVFPQIYEYMHVLYVHHEQTTYGPPGVRKEQETVRIDVVAYNRK